MPEMKRLTPEDLIAIATHRDQAHKMVSDLCHGDRKWIMSIPCRPDYDPYTVIARALRESGQLQRELEAMKAEAATVKESLTVQSAATEAELYTVEYEELAPGCPAGGMGPTWFKRVEVFSSRIMDEPEERMLRFAHRLGLQPERFRDVTLCPWREDRRDV